MAATQQEYALGRKNADGSFTNIASGSSTAIHAGTASNHLTVTWNGSLIALSANGTGLGAWTDNTITGSTGTGVVATSSSGNTANFDARFDNFSVTALP